MEVEKQKNGISMEHVERYKRLLIMREEYIVEGEKRIAILLPQLRQVEQENGRLKEDPYTNPVLLKQSSKHLIQLDRELNYERALLDYHRSEITNLLDTIREIEMGPNTLQSARLVSMASRNPVQNEHVKDARTTVHPLQRLRAHGPFYYQFQKNMEGYAGVPAALQRSGVTLKERYPIGGKTKRNRTRRRKNK